MNKAYIYTVSFEFEPTRPIWIDLYVRSWSEIFHVLTILSFSFSYLSVQSFPQHLKLENFLSLMQFLSQYLWSGATIQKMLKGK